MKVFEFQKTKIFKKCDDYSYCINEFNECYDPMYVEDAFLPLDVIGFESKPDGSIVINVFIPNFTSLTNYLYT